MQIAGLGTRSTGTCGTGTAVLGHAELGQRFWDSFYNVKMGKIVVCVIVLFHVVCDEGVFVGATRTGATRTAVLGHAELGQRFWDMRNWDSGSGIGATGTI